MFSTSTMKYASILTQHGIALYTTVPIFHTKAPSERFRSCFWVSRLNSDGTDERMGPIPNSIKAQEYLEAQGESKKLWLVKYSVWCTICFRLQGLDIPIYEEVEAHTGMRPVLIFGALADQVVASLLESYPTMFYCCNTGEWWGMHTAHLWILQRCYSDSVLRVFTSEMYKPISLL